MEISTLTAIIAKPGCSLRHLLEPRVAAGTFSGDVDEYIIKLEADVAEGQISNTIVKCDDGRIFSILNKPLNGGGLATHQDITQRHRAEGKIAYMAGHDSLTDLPKHQLPPERLEDERQPGRR